MKNIYGMAFVILKEKNSVRIPIITVRTTNGNGGNFGSHKEVKMFIKTWCLKCNWQGIAEVGHGLRIIDYECPECGYIIKRPYRGGRNLTDKKARLSYPRLEE